MVKSKKVSSGEKLPARPNVNNFPITAKFFTIYTSLKNLRASYYINFNKSEYQTREIINDSE